eukprot:CAMPEP_0178372798 /NCGR_PEP_ID=MMETSP0689_2-20121128/1539_1 /TAXON_ID=160604 /ORGANISM="Amphidinium massartii, Strain CS-259" /LENGTH=42 /DNA_ID= /DNA_START= /DNA_END= /DNA_ORIENTATION=
MMEEWNMVDRVTSKLCFASGGGGFTTRLLPVCTPSGSVIKKT